MSSKAKKQQPKRIAKVTKNSTAHNRAEEREEELFQERTLLRQQVESYLAKKHPEVVKKQKAEKSKGHSSNRRAKDDDQPTISISYPYTESQVRMVMHEFCQEKRPRIERDDLDTLLDKFLAAYSARRPNALGRMTVPEGGKLVVVGDTHGQLNDVLWIFVSQGVPTEKTYFLFNGDIADRGGNAIEIFIIVFMFFFLHPDAMLIHRGNHEDVFMNQMPKDGGGGFYDECMAKYDHGVYDKFHEIFKRLPLGSVINNEVFVVHGGIPRLNNFSLEYIDTLPWSDYTAPTTEASDMKSLVFLDMLWSDPVETMGKFPSRRGAGIQFGLDVSASFLRANKLKMIIRSHQCPADNHGYFVHHQGLCLTVFSASNYCGEVGNWGATVAFNQASWPQYTIAEYWAPDFADIKKELEKNEPIGDDAAKAIEDMSREQCQSGATCGDLGLSQATLQKMVIHLVQQKPELWTRFTAADPNSTTKVTLKEGCRILEECCGQTLPWKDSLDYWQAIEGLHAGEKADELNERLSLDYDEFLSRFRVELAENFQSWKFSAVNDAFSNLISKHASLKDLVAAVDKDGDGKVSKAEFKQILTESGVTLSNSQMETLMRHIGFSHGRDGDKIDTNEFLNRFALTHNMDESIAGHKVEKDQWAAIALEIIGHHVLKIPGEKKQDKKSWKFFSSNDGQDKPAGHLLAIFKQFDTSGDGSLSIAEFIGGMKQIPDLDQVKVEGKSLTEADFTRIANHVDASGDGTVDYLEFVAAFNLQDKQDHAVTGALCEDITTTLFRNRNALLAACHFFDVTKKQHITPDEFGESLEAVSQVLKKPEQPFTPAQIGRLVSAVSEATGHGDDMSVKYQDFVNSFELLDTKLSTDGGSHAKCVLRRTSLKQLGQDLDKGKA